MGSRSIAIRAFVNSKAVLFGYNLIDQTSALLFDRNTAQKICELAGYRSTIHVDCAQGYDTAGRCGWNSCNDHGLYFWNGANFVAARACDLGNLWLSTLTCARRPAACSDGIDNDADGNRDFPADLGCASANDQSEHPHDPACANPESSTEFEQCRNGIDDDINMLIDADDPGCWTDRSNPATYNPSHDYEMGTAAQCQDSLDNDRDGKIDFEDPGCWGAIDDDESNVAQVSECKNEGATQSLLTMVTSLSR